MEEKNYSYTSKIGQEDVHSIENPVAGVYNSGEKVFQNSSESISERRADLSIEREKDVITERKQRQRNLITSVFRSVRAAIMGRNMSHNIGSHVLSYLKIKLQDVENILDNQVLSRLLNDIPKDKARLEIDKETLELPFLVGLGHFIALLQERQDYIATIATDSIPVDAPVDFKEAIFDGLNPDYRWERHKKDKGKNTMNGKEVQNILMDYIALSEGLARHSSGDLGKIVFWFGYDEENKWKMVEGYSREVSIHMRGMQLSLPGGMLGRQAIFSIIENIIRNAAKHETRSLDNKNLDITLGLINGTDIKHTKGLSTNLTEILTSGGIQHIGDYWFMTVSYNYDKKNPKEDIEKMLNTPFVDEDLIFNNKCRGIKEILFSSAFIRRESNLSDAAINYIEELLYKPSINIVAEKNSLFIGDEEIAKLNDEISKTENEIKTNPDNKAELEEKLNKQKQNLWNLKLVKSFRLSPKPGEPKFVYVDSDQEKHLISYVIPIRKVLPLMICTEGMSDEDKSFFEQPYKDDLWQYCDNADTLNRDKRCFQYYIVANAEIYKKVRPYGTNRIVIWDKRDIQMREYLNCDNEIFFHRLMRVVGALHSNSKLHLKEEDVNAEDVLWIEDDQAWDAHEKDNNDAWTSYYGLLDNLERRILQKLVQFAPDPDEADKVSFLYRTHHETNEYHGYLSNRYSKERNACYDNCFVEGISGGNSTDRIIRREPYSFDMFYQHIYAAERRVAIIDERVFKDIHGVDASECLFEGQILEGPKAYRSLQYSQKGIDVFSIVPLDADKKKFAIIGCEIKEEPEGKCCCHQLAEIEIQLAEIENEKNYNLKIENHATIYNKYDYVSIHQGLLDKLYELFREKRKEKINAVNSICELFMVEDSLFEDKKNVAFHPNFIIHSGRGKCTNEDMPQQVPFVSYAQLSQAINDCKFNLVQLFDFLRYENN